MDDMDESLSAGKSDEEILAAFLRDGCDLDGTPLLLIGEAGPSSWYSFSAATRH